MPPARSAHHTRGYNARSIGIELVNTGRYPHWLDSRQQAMDEPYTDAQIAALIALLQRLCGGNPVAGARSPATRTWTATRSKPATTPP